MNYFYFDILSDINVMRCTFRIENLLKGGQVNLRCVQIEMKNDQEGIPLIQKYTDIGEKGMKGTKQYFTQLWKARWTNILKTYILTDSFGDSRYSRIPLKASKDIPKLNACRDVYFEDYED